MRNLVLIIGFIVVFFQTNIVMASSQLPISSALNEWVIGPIYINENDPSDAYCSMKNKFSNNTVIVFARDAEGSNSIALDFVNPVLKKGEEYKVILSIPPRVTRNITAVAVTSRVMIMQMGFDFHFYDAVSQKSEFKINANNRDLLYSLKGSSEALLDLDDCVTELQVDPAYAMQKVKSHGNIIKRKNKSLVKKKPVTNLSSGVSNSLVLEELEKLKRDINQLKNNNIASNGNVPEVEKQKSLTYIEKSQVEDIKLQKQILQENFDQKQLEMQKQINQLKQSIKVKDKKIQNLSQGNAFEDKIEEIKKKNIDRAIKKTNQKKQDLKDRISVSDKIIHKNKQRFTKRKPEKAISKEDLKKMVSVDKPLNSKKDKSGVDIVTEGKDNIKPKEEDVAKVEIVTNTSKKPIEIYDVDNILQKSQDTNIPVKESPPKEVALKEESDEIEKPGIFANLNLSKFIKKDSFKLAIEPEPASNIVISTPKILDHVANSKRLEKIEKIEKAESSKTRNKSVSNNKTDAVQVNKRSKTDDQLKEILTSAQILTDGGLQKMPMKNPGNIAYKWNKDQVFAGAKKSKWNSNKSFMEQVDTYLKIVKDQCDTKSNSDLGLIKTNHKGHKILDARIECKTGGDNPIASFLFYGSKLDDQFTVFSHETTKANIIQAERDKAKIKKILLKNEG